MVDEGKDKYMTGKKRRTFEDLIKEGFASEEELQKLGAGKLRVAVIDGECQMGSLMAGQVAGMIKEIESCHEIVEDVIMGAEKILKSFC